MCHLLTDTSISVQRMAYQLLHGAAKKRTEHLVIETGVDVDAIVKADLPSELLEILQRSLNQADGSEHDEHVRHVYLSRPPPILIKFYSSCSVISSVG